jgi:hypothetical protein
LEKEEVSAPEIWDIFHKAPRIPQVHWFPSLLCYTCYST